MKFSRRYNFPEDYFPKDIFPDAGKHICELLSSRQIYLRDHVLQANVIWANVFRIFWKFYFFMILLSNFKCHYLPGQNLPANTVLRKTFARKTFTRMTFARMTFVQKNFFQMRANVFRANFIEPVLSPLLWNTTL
jgi:hypothetical protein